MNVKIPTHVHAPNPSWVSLLEGKRVFLDVGVALRAALFPESYSRKVLEHIERTKNGMAVFSPHIRDEGLRVLSKVAPASRPEFISYLRKLSDRKVLDEVPNGDPCSLREWKSLGQTDALIQRLNPMLRGWGEYFKRAHVRRIFNRLDRWVVRRIWSHRFKRWRCAGWQALPTAKLYGELGLVNLIRLIPSLASQRTESS